MFKIIVASNNNGKVEEIQDFLKELSIEALPQSAFNVPEIEEIGLTYVENAILKARNACQHTGLPAFGDDSGVEVTALNGAPGLYTARYAGPNATFQDNINKLLQAMTDVPAAQRAVRFRCVIAFLRHTADPNPVICQGVWEGSVLFEPRGQQGHGYDPIFYVPTHNCSAAELSLQEKTRISHRGRALQRLIEALKEIYGESHDMMN